MKGAIVFLFTLFLLLTSPLSVNARELPDFSVLVERYSPAVVKIQVEMQAASGLNGQGLPPNQELPEPFRRYFQMPAPQDGIPQQGLGSGFIIESDGYILTNYHVISGANKITVRLADRREFDAQVIGSDARSDLALLKIKADGLPTLRLDANDDLKVGEWVLAIGSPFGLDYSVAQGIVSAMGRSLPNVQNENYVPFIQTDVAINPGNSGGPLFNLDGDVVGINSQIYTRSGGSMGLSFAIPASVARNVVAQLKEHGAVVRGWLGVSIQEVDTELAKSFGLTKPEGALVAQVITAGPAENGGIKVGDIITAFNGAPILFSADLPHQVGLVSPGTSVELSLIRNGKLMKTRIDVGELPDEGQSSALRKATGKNPQELISGPLGLEVVELDAQQRKQWRMNGGVLVRNIKPGSAAAHSGLQPGDVIVQLGFSAINNVADFLAVAEALPAGSIQPLRFFRDGHPSFRSIIIE
ncbi:MAG TPA: DegQ family serine endoprotease [Pseudomonadales bacterium]|nr:DegQ family serine endoprotease [Pseudomonadales bacterium]